MNKLRLELDELSVESFDVDGGGDGSGTVLAQSEVSLHTDCLGSCGGTAYCSHNGSGCDYSCEFACTDACTYVGC